MAKKTALLAPAGAFIASKYTGTLSLDNQNNVAFLSTSLGASAINALLQLDPGSSGAYDPAKVTQAYQYFSTAPGCFNGAVISIAQGCLMPNNNHWILYVVSP